MNRAVPVIILLFNYAFAQPGTAESRTLIQEEATVEIQYDGHVGSGVILMTSDPACCTTSATSNLSKVLSPNTTVVGTSSSSCTLFNTPLVFGTSRTQMINVTSAGHYLFPTATGSSQMMTGTATQSPSLSNSSPTYAALVTGSGTRRDVTWSHVFFWAAITEIISYLL
ncbi:hypothetical protein F5882DRAFT_374975 [Hyaloscypha sp. PMI_1271]|nr:hypothetical protein F5882DRAFT_374975 [Hyaloscypha sp. PMI_1271]